MCHKIDYIKLFMIAATLLYLQSCNKAEDSVQKLIIPGTDDFDINSINDTYYDLASVDRVFDWGLYNTHDPSIVGRLSVIGLVIASTPVGSWTEKIL